MAKTALVTGANRGIGFAVAKKLAIELGKDATVFVSARSLDKAEAAIADINNPSGAKLVPLRLDLSDTVSIEEAAEAVKASGGLDILIQNGAFAATAGGDSADEARPMIAANNTGVLNVLRAFMPLLKDNARALVVASGFGTLGAIEGEARAQLANSSLSPEGVDAVMQAYVAAAEAGEAEGLGWGDWVNIPSKVGQVALTRAAARELVAKGDRGILLNAACPGWTMTEAAAPYLKNMPDVEAQSPDEAAVDLVWLATLPAGTSGPQGELVQHRKVVPFEGAHAA